MVAVCLEWISYTYVCFIMMIMVAVGIAAFLFMISLTKDMQCILDAIDKNSKIKRKRSKIPLQFVEFIELYSDGKQLSRYHFFYRKR